MESYALNAQQILTLIFVTLGPERIIGPFSEVTFKLKIVERLKLSVTSGLVSLLCLMGAGFIGMGLIHEWGIPPMSLTLAGGIIFFLIALKPLVYPEVSEKKSVRLSPVSISLNMIITTYGVATLIVLLAMSRDNSRTLLILEQLGLVMIMNILAMSLGHYFLKFIGPVPWRVFTLALKTLQLALAVTLILMSLKHMGIIL